MPNVSASSNATLSKLHTTVVTNGNLSRR